MSLLRRWFDPIRSNWFYKNSSRQAVLSIERGLTIHLRLDDVYSYLAVQELPHLEQILIDDLKPLKIVISSRSAAIPNHMSEVEWQNYCLKDAQILAKQHRFTYPDHPQLPDSESILQAQTILKNTPLRGEAFLHLLEQVFHMLWQKQHGKLKTLYSMASQHHHLQHYPERIFNDAEILASYFEFGERKYHAVDDLLRLARRLKQQHLLTDNPIFLINHIEWREHLIRDSVELSEIQALNSELDLYIALEDPISWLLLAYIQEELVDYYNIHLNIYPLSYRGRDHFDWNLATRLSKRTEVKFTPFCRPDAQGIEKIAQLFYSVAKEQRVQTMHRLLQAVWTQGKDLNFLPHFEELKQNLSIENLCEENIPDLLAQNDVLCEMKSQPNFPVLELRVDGENYIFNSLYRVWMIESIFNNVLEELYKKQSDGEKYEKREI